MKKIIFALILLFVTFNSFSQDIIGKKSTSKPNYSENSEIKVIYIPTDKRYDHISSSAIKGLMKFDNEKAKEYLI